MAPFGVVGRIVPFNHPMMFAAAKSAAPLIAGNTVVIKPSEHTSTSALRLAELAAQVFPPGVVNVVTGYGDEAGDALVAHPAVRRLAFTGSAEIGRAIQARAATHVVKTVTLELGGKNPIVVCADADIEAAIDGALRGMAFTWQGQSCGSTSRLLVQRSLHEEFVARLGARMDALRGGLAGGRVDRHRRDRPPSPVREGALLPGARARGGLRGARRRRPARRSGARGGMFVRPTLFDNVRPDSRLAQEEIFGPVLAAMPFETYDEALAIANGVSLGLTASIYTRDLATAHRFARDVEAGYVWVNDTQRHVPGTRLRWLQGFRRRPRGGRRRARLLRADQERQRQLRVGSRRCSGRTPSSS